MSSLTSPRTPGSRWWSRTVGLLAGVALAAWIGACGSVSNKTDAGGAGGSGAGGAPGDGAADATGTGGAPGDAATDGPPADGGGAARWDIDNWDNAQWGP